MRYECQFQMKTLLNVFLLVQRSPLAFIDYHAMLSLHKRQREREREREIERVNMIMKVQDIIKHFL